MDRKEEERTGGPAAQGPGKNNGPGPGPVKEAIIRLIFGMRGEGKTYYTQRQLASFKKIIVYDTLHQYGQFGLCFSSLEDFKRHLLKNYKKSCYRLIYQPIQPLEDFESICEIVYLLGNVAFVVEEIGLFISPLAIGPELANIIQRGRHKGIEFFGVNQRPFGIPRLLTSQAKEIVSFRQREPRDIEYFREFIGEEAEKILTLPKYHFLKWTYEKIVIEKS